MKKHISILSILFCLTIFLGCNTNETEEKIKEVGAFVEWGLDVKTEVQIRRDYLEKYIRPQFPEAGINDVWVEKFYGIYNWPETHYATFGRYPGGLIDWSRSAPNNDAVAVIMGSICENEKWEEATVCKICFYHDQEHRVIIWFERGFYTVNEALNDYNLRTVYYTSGLEITTNILNGYGNGFSSLRSYISGLSMEIDWKIKEILRERDIEWRINNSSSSLISFSPTLDWYWVSNYYGTYNECVVIRNVITNIEAPKTTHINVAGINFFSRDRQHYVFYEGELYEWLEAYEMDLLTLNDLKTIAHRYYNCRVIVNENLELERISDGLIITESNWLDGSYMD